MEQLFIKTKFSLNEIISMLKLLQGKEIYSKPCSFLSNATIGQHTRHIIELFQCLINGYDKANINYDNRKRSVTIETQIEFAIIAIENIINTIDKPNKPLEIDVCSYGNSTNISTNYYRELLYNFEHCIHHQALIKVALHAEEYIEIPTNFGVATSTIEYRDKCAQ